MADRTAHSIDGVEAQNRAGTRAATRSAVLAELRRLMPGVDDIHSTLPFGLPALDSHLPRGGLARGALHEIVPETEGAIAAAFGFLVAVLARFSSPPPCGERLGVGVERGSTSVDACASPHAPYPPPRRSREQISPRLQLRPVIFILPAYGPREHGRLYGHVSGHGLNSLGLDPACVTLVQTAHRKDTLWAMAEALHSGVPQAVAAAIDRLDLRTSQKLQLAANDSGRPLFLMRPAPTLEASAAATRWRVGMAQAARDPFGLITRPCWHLQLERCRNGRPGEWKMEYDHVTHRFSLAAALADHALYRSPNARSYKQASRS